MSRHRIALIQAPFSGGAGIPGCELAPSALRMAGLTPRLRDAGLWVRALRPDFTACGGVGRVSREDLRRACSAVRGAVTHGIEAGELPVLLGGDHSLSIGSIAAVADHCRRWQRPLWVLWLDAHADFNTPDTSPSGNAHGMPAAVVCGKGEAGLLSLSQRMPMVDPARLHLVGVRAMDAGERALVRESAVALHTMEEVRERGLWEAVEPVLRGVAAGGGHLHLSLDVDAIDPTVAPGVGTPEAGGLGGEEILNCLQGIARSGLLGSVDVMEFNPLHDRCGVTARLVIRCIVSCLTTTLPFRASPMGQGKAQSAGNGGGAPFQGLQHRVGPLAGLPKGAAVQACGGVALA